jgi:hypothetical protein
MQYENNKIKNGYMIKVITLPDKLSLFPYNHHFATCWLGKIC